MGAYNYPFSAEKFKVRGEIATDDDSVVFLHYPLGESFDRKS